MEPIISIVAPVYNVEPYLRQCLDSLINQTFRDIEIILVNDGSKDQSGSICDEYAVKDNRVRVIHQANSGVSKAREVGTAATTGQCLMYIDSDDWLDLDTCQIAYDALMRNDADLVTYSYYREYPNNTIPQTILGSDMVFKGEDVREKLLKRHIGLTSRDLVAPHKFDVFSAMYMKLYKRELIVDNNLSFIDTREIFPGEDTIFVMEIFALANTVVHIEKPLYHYRRQVATSATSVIPTDYFEKWQKHYAIMEAFIVKSDLPEPYHHALSNRIALESIGLFLKETNPRNKRSFINKLRFIKMVLNKESYVNAYKGLEMQYLPIHWRLFFTFCKYKMPLGVFMLAKVMRVLKSRV